MTGCEVCGTADTATVDGVHGRRCAEHPPVFDPAHAVRLAVGGQLTDALRYCRQVAP